MTIKNKSLKEYLYQVFMATGLLLVALPYVLLTNTTATTAAIIIHSLLMWALLPPLVLVVELWRIKRASTNPLPYIVFTLIAITIASTITVIIFHLISGEPYNVLLSPALWAALLPIYSAYMLILAARLWREQQLSSLKLQAQRDQAAFKALSSQLKPHFLFNTINTIEYLVSASPDKAKECLQLLSQLYRGILNHSEKNLISIDDEVQLCNKYIDLQKHRFEEKLMINWNIHNETKGYFIPPSILLNALENSCKHGIETMLDPEPISVSINSLDKKYYHISIVNSFESSSNRVSESFGHKDLKERLAIIYSTQAQINISNNDRLYKLELTLPKDIVE